MMDRTKYFSANHVDTGFFKFNVNQNPGYIEVHDFERIDFVWLHRLLSANIPFLVSLAAVYLVTVFVVKKWMEGREAFELRKPLFFWNVGLAGLSMMMFARTWPELVYINKTHGFYASYCSQDYFNAATMFWLIVYTASKVLEFGDTMFILLRKQKLTFLHVFHHTSVYIACIWGLLRVDPTSRYFAQMNCFVHSVMYSYYALKAAQVKLPRKLAMAVTSTQLLQFGTAIGINLLVAYAKIMKTEPRCERPEDINMAYSALAIIYFYLFGKFFVDSYMKKPKTGMMKPKVQ